MAVALPDEPFDCDWLGDVWLITVGACDGANDGSDVGANEGGATTHVPDAPGIGFAGA